MAASSLLARDHAASDQALMTRIRERDAVALDELYTLHNHAIYGLAHRFMNDTMLAEDVALEVFLRVWNNAVQWDATKGTLLSWMFSITHHVAIDMMRRHRHSVEYQADELNDELQKVIVLDFDESSHFEHELLNKLLAQLPANQSEVLMLAFYQGMTHVEMAKHLHIPLGTVKTRVRLGIQKLRILWLKSNESASVTGGEG